MLRIKQLDETGLGGDFGSKKGLKFAVSICG